MTETDKDKATKALKKDLTEKGIMTCQLLGNLVTNIPPNLVSLQADKVRGEWASWPTCASFPGWMVPAACWASLRRRFLRHGML